VVSQLKVNEIIKQSGSSITIGEAGDTVSGPFTNVPAFFMKLSANQSISHNTVTVIGFNDVQYDTHSAFNTSNYRFVVPTGHAGKYIFTLTAGFSNPNETAADRFQLFIKKNDEFTDFAGDLAQATDGNADPTMNFTTQFELAAGDYVDGRIFQNGGDSETLQFAYARFFGYRLIGA
jgi:hypothetical protein